MRCAEVAQSVEQRPEKPRVGGSIPPLGTTSTFFPKQFPLFLDSGSILPLPESPDRRCQSAFLILPNNRHPEHRGFLPKIPVRRRKRRSMSQGQLKTGGIVHCQVKLMCDRESFRTLVDSQPVVHGYPPSACRVPENISDLKCPKRGHKGKIGNKGIPQPFASRCGLIRKIPGEDHRAIRTKGMNDSSHR